MSKRCALLIKIPEKEIEEEFGPFYKVAWYWGERVAWTYLVKHHDKIELNLELLGVGELFNPKTKPRERQPHHLDLLFRKGHIYYPVEVKEDIQAWGQLSEEVECFENGMQEQGVQYEEIIPVLVVYGKEIQRFSKERRLWPEWWEKSR